MPAISHARRELLLKIVYYGPGLGGKTTNLEWIHANSKPEHRGRLLSLTNETERTLFFDLLPVHLGRFKGYGIRLHVCTVPGQVRFDETRRLILRHVDGVVFVVDSQPEQLEANVEALQNLATNLRLQGDDPDRMPVVVQFNKRDLPGVVPIHELEEWLGVPRGMPRFEASAVHGQGVLETLKSIVSQCLKLVGDPKRAKEGRSPSILPGRRASLLPGAVPEAARSQPAGGSEAPAALGSLAPRASVAPAALGVPSPPRLPSIDDE